MIAEAAWNDYCRDGFMRLGQFLGDDELAALRARTDDVAAGRIVNSALQMQLDTGGAYESLPNAVPRFDQPTRLYRKIQGLENDELFGRLVRHDLIREICAWHYGAHSPVSLFRAMVMNKPAGQGTMLPWHQDGGDVWALDRDPLVTIWIALDRATRANGCLEIVPGTHRLGLLTARGGTLSDDDARRHCPASGVESLEVEAGHGVLLHNWLIHRSGVNPSAIPRRAFTACYMDGRTQSTLTGNFFPLVWGTRSAEPYPFVRQLRHDCDHLRHSAAKAEEYALSLQRENQALRVSRDEAERYAKSLEVKAA